MMSAFSSYWSEDHNPHDLLRWTVAATIVVGIHAGAVALLLKRHPPEDIGDDTDVVTVELAPIDSTPKAVAHDTAFAPETMIESEAVPQPQKDERDEEVKLEQPPDEAPALVPIPTAKPPEQAEEARPPAPRTAEQVKGGAPRIEPSWQTMLVRQLQRAKRYPPEAQSRNEQGVVLLSLSLDRNGHVLAHRVAKSSGYADLDNEVMDMITRAQPLPAFPPSMMQAKLDLSIPIRFSLR
jgi:periplasmic protein TonB